MPPIEASTSTHGSSGLDRSLRLGLHIEIFVLESFYLPLHLQLPSMNEEEYNARACTARQNKKSKRALLQTIQMRLFA